MGVVITDRASAQFDRLRQSRQAIPRIEIRAGGCNGFEKIFTFDDSEAADDLKIPTTNGMILIDPISYAMLDNAIVDYVSDLSGSSFSITIPEATSTCGCGSSFSL